MVLSLKATAADALDLSPPFSVLMHIFGVISVPSGEIFSLKDRLLHLKQNYDYIRLRVRHVNRHRGQWPQDAPDEIAVGGIRIYHDGRTKVINPINLGSFGENRGYDVKKNLPGMSMRGGDPLEVETMPIILNQGEEGHEIELPGININPFFHNPGRTYWTNIDLGGYRYHHPHGVVTLPPGVMLPIPVRLPKTFAVVLFMAEIDAGTQGFKDWINDTLHPIVKDKTSIVKSQIISDIKIIDLSQTINTVVRSEMDNIIAGGNIDLNDLGNIELPEPELPGLSDAEKQELAISALFAGGLHNIGWEIGSALFGPIGGLIFALGGILLGPDIFFTHHIMKEEVDSYFVFSNERSDTNNVSRTFYEDEDKEDAKYVLRLDWQKYNH